MEENTSPTNRDILEGMNERFNMVFTELKKNDAKFDLVYRQISTLHEDVKEIKQAQKEDGEVLDEVRDTLNAMSKAVDADAVTIIDHETRITKLEGVTA